MVGQFGNSTKNVALKPALSLIAIWIFTASISLDDELSTIQALEAIFQHHIETGLARAYLGLAPLPADGRLEGQTNPAE